MKEALENKKVSVNRGWKIMKAVQQLPPEEQEPAAVEMLSAVRKIDQLALIEQDLVEETTLMSLKNGMYWMR